MGGGASSPSSASSSSSSKKLPPLEAMDREVDMARMMGLWYVLSSRPTPFEKNAFNATERYEWDPEPSSGSSKKKKNKYDKKSEKRDGTHTQQSAGSGGSSAEAKGDSHGEEEGNSSDGDGDGGGGDGDGVTGRGGRFRVTFGFNKGGFDGPHKEMYQKGRVHSANCSEWRVRPKLLGFYLPVQLPFLIIDRAEDYSWVTVGYPSRAYLWIMARSRSVKPELYEHIQQRAVAQGYDASKIHMVPQREPTAAGAGADDE